MRAVINREIMGFYNNQVLPRLIHCSMNNAIVHKIRTDALAAAEGTVLEIGFGSGLNLPHYPPGVTRLLAVEPSQVARRMARKAIAAAAFPVEFVGLDGQSLDLPEAAVDRVVSTFTLCTIPDATRAVAEIARVLRPGGRLLFAEHGLSPDAGVARWQHRLNGLQRRVAGGCQLNRKIDALIEQSPLRISMLNNFYLKGPRTHGYVYLGSADMPA